MCILLCLVTTGFVATALFECMIAWFCNCLFVWLTLAIIGSLNVHSIVGVVCSTAGRFLRKRTAPGGKGL